jgi:hypothetical protein
LLPAPTRPSGVLRGFSNPSAPHRLCANEQALVEIYGIDHSFDVVAPADLAWREQIALFRMRRLWSDRQDQACTPRCFSRSGGRLASIDFMNLVQARIAALRGLDTAYFAEGMRLSGEYVVEGTAFRKFLNATCTA